MWLLAVGAACVPQPHGFTVLKGTPQTQLPAARAAVTSVLDVDSRSSASASSIRFATSSIQLVTPAQRGGLKGAANVKVAFARWFARQVRAGYATYLDLVMFRRLGVGLAARIWAYLEAESYELKGRDRETKAIGLGPPAVAALDLAGYKRARDARRALSRAAERIVVTDPRYEAVDVRPGVYGYDLYVVRRRGDRLREHRRVREALRTSLRDA